LSEQYQTWGKQKHGFDLWFEKNYTLYIRHNSGYSKCQLAWDAAQEQQLAEIAELRAKLQRAEVVVEAARIMRKIQIEQQNSVLTLGDIMIRNSAEDWLDNALHASIDGGKS
jgi:hypothetical protein